MSSKAKKTLRKPDPIIKPKSFPHVKSKGSTKKAKVSKGPEPYLVQKLGYKDPRHKDQSYYVLRYKGNFSIDEIKQFAQKKSNNLKKDSPESASFRVCINFDDIGPKSGDSTLPGSEISLYDGSDSDVVTGDSTKGFDIILTLPN